MSERLFRVIVGGRYTGAPEEGKEKFLLGSCEIVLELGVRFILLASCIETINDSSRGTANAKNTRLPH